MTKHPEGPRGGAEPAEAALKARKANLESQAGARCHRRCGKNYQDHKGIL